MRFFKKSDAETLSKRGRNTGGLFIGRGKEVVNDHRGEECSGREFTAKSPKA